MEVELERSVAEDLVSFKLRSIQSEIASILNKWQYTSIEDFISDVKSGKLREAENDAIEIRHLSEEQDNLMGIQEKIRG